jgi:hypothetical protein
LITSVKIRTRKSIFGGELDIVGVFARPLHRLHRALHHLILGHAQLVLHVDGRSGDERVNAPVFGRLDRLARSTHILFTGTRQRTHGRTLDHLGNAEDRVGIAGAGSSKARLDHIHAQLFQLARDAQLLFFGHGRAGALLAVAQGCVEYD